MVVVPEPAVKCGAALGARAVDRAVGPAGEQRADEAFGLAVRLRAVGTRAAVPDPERATGERVDRSAVAGAVVGQDPLDRDPVPPVVRDGPAQEGDRGDGLLVAEHLRVGEAAVVVDRDVHVLPADRVAPPARAICEGALVMRVRAAADALAGAALDPAELLDVEVDELARSGALEAKRLLETGAPEPPHPRPLEHRRDRREGHSQRLRDLGRGEAQPAQMEDQLNTLGGRGVGDAMRRRRAVVQALLAFVAVASDPLPRAADAPPRLPPARSIH